MPDKRRRARKEMHLKDTRERALYIRLPHKITSKEEVEKLLLGDVEVKLFRQASRHCIAVFPTVEDKMKNIARYKSADKKDFVIDFVRSQNPDPPVIKPSKKKVVMPEVKEDARITQKIFISNVKCGTKAHEIKEALEGCTAVTMLPPYSHNLRSALAKMDDIKIAGEYLMEERKWPVVRGHSLVLKPDTRIKHKHTKSKKSNNSSNRNTAKKKPKIKIDEEKDQETPLNIYN